MRTASHLGSQQSMIECPPFVGGCGVRRACKMQNDITRCVHASGHQCILQLSSVGDHSCRLRVGLVEWQLNMSTMTAGIHRQNCGKYLDRSTQRFGIGWENGRVHKHKHVPHHSNLASCWTRIAPIDGPTGSPKRTPNKAKGINF